MSTFIRSFVTIAAVVFIATPALAGPPLICHPFTVDGGQLIAWGSGPGWNTPDRSYDIKRLVADTNAVLTPDAPILNRMENLRRAAIYAMRDPVIADQLLKSVMSRALATTTDGRAWFDAGYLIETYKQAMHLRDDRKSELRTWEAVNETIKVDGYNWVKKSMAMSGSSPELEFAASLMTQGSIASAHRAKAAASAAKGSTLSKNLASSAFLF